MGVVSRTALLLFGAKTRSAKRGNVRKFLLETLERRDLMASVPVATDDPLYTTPINTDLVISSSNSAVSANDFEVDFTSLTASVVTSPAHGSLVSFNSDGTFTYRPTTA